MPYDLSIVIKLFLAALLGGLIGLERESSHKSAGFRTNILVCLGSCLIAITSIEMHTSIGQGIIADPGRIAAQVVSGIGFLGAGTILRSKSGVRGLTTAATLWVVAGIGLAVGVGIYWPAILTTVIVLTTLIWLSRIERRIEQKRFRHVEIIIDDKSGSLALICERLNEMEVRIRNLQVQDQDAGSTLLVTLLIDIPYNLAEVTIVEKLKELTEVKIITFS